VKNTTTNGVFLSEKKSTEFLGTMALTAFSRVNGSREGCGGLGVNVVSTGAKRTPEQPDPIAGL
jgi:hypothetical protein